MQTDLYDHVSLVRCCKVSVTFDGLHLAARPILVLFLTDRDKCFCSSRVYDTSGARRDHGSFLLSVITMQLGIRK